MDNKRYLAIDIGKHGGICIMNHDGSLFTYKIPLNKEGELDIAAMRTVLSVNNFNNLHVAFEALTPLHLASKKSNWSLALQAGAIEALCIALGIPYSKIHPKIWQAKMFEKLPPMREKDGTKDTKLMALMVVKTLYPDINVNKGGKSKKVEDGIVDSILICHYTKELNL